MPFDVQAPEPHFVFEVTTAALLLGAVTGGFGRVLPAVGPDGVAPVAPGVTVPGDPGLARPATGPGFGGVGGGEEAWVAPPIAGAGFATPPSLFCWGLAPPSALWASAGETLAMKIPSAPAIIHFIVVLFMLLFTAVPRALRARISLLYVILRRD